MNKFLTFAGQQPVYLGDIDFVQNAAGNVFALLARALADMPNDNLNAILQGVDVSYGNVANTWQWTAGVVVLNGEILPVSAGSIGEASASAHLYFHVNVVQGGSRTMHDGSTKSCWEIRTAIIDTESEDGVDVASVPRYEKYVGPDDAVYVGVAGMRRPVVGGKLIRKNGLWYCDIAVGFGTEGGAGYTDLGPLTFSGLPTAHLQQLAGQAAYIPMCIYVAYPVAGQEGTFGDPLLEFQPVVVAFGNADLLNNAITMSVAFNNPTLKISGGSTIRALIPIF